MNSHNMLFHMLRERELTLGRTWNFVTNYFHYLLKKPIISGVPSLLMIEPTNLCNLHCPLCPTGNGSIDAPRGSMKPGDFKKIIDELGNRILYLTMYNYGEPFLNRELLTMIEYAKQQRIFIRISTNGHFFENPAERRRLVASGLDHLIIALDGATPETFRTYRRGGNFERVIGNIGKIVEEKRAQRSKTPYVELLFVVMKHNAHEIPTIKSIGEEIGVDRVKLKTIHLKSYTEDSAEIAETYLPEDLNLTRYKQADGKLVAEHSAGHTCKWLWLGSVINWDGSVVPCCYDPNRTLSPGNVFEVGSFREIWNNTQYISLRNTIRMNKNTLELCRFCPGTFTGPDTG